MTRIGRRFWSVWVLAAVLLGAVAACGGNDDQAGDTQPRAAADAPGSSDQGPGTAFSFADDDLCEWITADEVAGFFASVYDWDGVAEVSSTGDRAPDECWWRLISATGGAFYEVFAGNARPGALLPAEVVLFDGGPVSTPGGTVSGHPALSDGVVVQREGWGVYAFWVPPRDDALALFFTRLSTRVLGEWIRWQAGRPSRNRRLASSPSPTSSFGSSAGRRDLRPEPSGASTGFRAQPPTSTDRLDDEAPARPRQQMALIRSLARRPERLCRRRARKCPRPVTWGFVRRARRDSNPQPSDP